MQLKRLEIHGFKSFAEKTTLEFDEGITAIVGPNGCGKTNILDAIRWVLGEQSSKLLRCDRMENLIFNGSETRRALGMATVSMTLINNQGVLPIEYDEITVKRELFRSGESNYYLNKASCRLKDITDLFMDTGLGSHVYSIIEQSQIDLILSNKPSLRRLLFEEAAGISKFKNRKEIAARKLEGTSQNLERLSDIIQEVSSQRNSLKRQADKAVRYQTLKDELMKLEGRLLKKKQAALQSTLSTCQKKSVGLELELAAKEAVYEETVAKTETARLKLAEKESDLKQKAAAVAQETLSYEKTESGIVLKREKIEALKRQEDASHSEIINRQERLQYLSRQMQGEEAELKDAKKGMDSKTQTLGALNEELANLKEQLSEQETAFTEEEEQLNAHREEHNTVLNRLAASQTEEEYLSEEHQKLTERISSKEERLKESLKLLEAKEKELILSLAEQGTRQAALFVGKEKRRQEEKKLENHRLERAQVEGKHSEIISLIKALEELHQRRRGFFAGVKSVLKLKEDKPQEWGGIKGVVADLVRSDERYRLALETAAGSQIQHIVTQSAAEAQKAIDYLKAEQSGRASFLPLDLIESPEVKIDPALLEAPGVIGPAWELIKIAPEYASLARLIWGKTLVVDNLTNAISLARQTRVSWKLVTLEGDLVNKGGAISGGYQGGEDAGLLMRESRIASLKKSGETLAEEIAKLKAVEKELVAKRDRLNQEIEAGEHNLHEQELIINNLRHAANVFDAESKRLAEEIEFAQTEKQHKEAARTKLQTDWQAHKEREKALADQIQARSTRVAAKKETIVSWREKIEEAIGKSTVLKVALAAFSEKERSLRQKKIELTEQEKQLHEEIQARKESQVKAIQEQESLREAIVADEETIKQTGQRLKELEAEHLKEENVRQELLTVISEMESSGRRSRQDVLALQEQMNALRIELTRQEVELTTYTEKLSNYQYLEIDLTEDEEFDPEERELRITRLRDKIIRLEPVNLAALDEFKEIEKRYQFLTAQVKDLEDARHSLKQTINQIKRTSEARFQETFQIIQENFELLFRRFFGGGKTTLVLTDAADPLESGIEIMAQPRGKKPQSITQLSGGERALTAIALVFAIFMVKPGPFCILDEVDAPLDETNIQRYTDLLGDFARASQFLTITHNKRTMEAASTLYGVTTEEVGVSKIVSMRLQEQPSLDLLEASVS